MMNQPDQSTLAKQSPEPVRWRCWPLRENLMRALMVLAGLLGAGLLVDWLSGETYLAIMALLVLMASLWRFFLPVVFEVSEEGVHQRCLGRHRCIPWRAIGRYEICAAGVLLLPGDKRSILAPFGGLYLPWAAYRDEIIAIVDYYLRRPEASRDR